MTAQIKTEITSPRNPVFDIMKGIGIILVMFGHVPQTAYINVGCLSADSIYWFVQHVFPPFKMPMFFLLAGYFTKPYVPDNEQRIPNRHFILKKFKRLIIPYLVSYGLLILWSCIPAICKHDWHMPVRHLLSMLWGGGILFLGQECLVIILAEYVYHTHGFYWLYFGELLLFM